MLCEVLFLRSSMYQETDPWFRLNWLYQLCSFFFYLTKLLSESDASPSDLNIIASTNCARVNDWFATRIDKFCEKKSQAYPADRNPTEIWNGREIYKRSIENNSRNIEETGVNWTNQNSQVFDEGNRKIQRLLVQIRLEGPF